MKKVSLRSTLLALSLGAALVGSAAASELSYSYIEAGWSKTDIRYLNPTGWAVGGSAAVGSRFHVFGRYAEQDDSSSIEGIGGRLELDADHWTFGIGYNHTLRPGLDLLARVAYERATVDLGISLPIGGSINENSLSAEVGVRGLMGNHVEGWVLAGWHEARGGSGEFYGRVGGQYRFNQRWGVVAEALLADDANQYFVGPRISF
jgi:Ax21 family sulfation-dependent quorum factor